MEYMFVTRLVSQQSGSLGLNESHHVNMSDMVVTLLVSHPFSS